jgi:hypothetical protein
VGAWVIGQNVAGYLPEPDDTPAFADWSAAADALREMMRDYADRDDEDAFEDDQPAMRAAADSILADDGPETGVDWACQVVDGRGRPIVFWVSWSDDRYPDDDDPNW